MDQVAHYPYLPLDLPSETRILTIHPGSKDDEIKCSLSHIKIGSEEAKYEALSYCWSKCTEREPPTPDTTLGFAIHSTALADEHPSTFYENFQQYLRIPGCESLYYRLGGRAPGGTILCDKHPIVVGGELYAALGHLRSFHDDEPFNIWIDAICVNQYDVEERNEHVRIMDRIYAGASMVRIWLGEEFGKEHQASIALEQIDEVFTRLDTGVHQDRSDMSGYRFTLQREFYWDEKIQAIDWDAVGSILARSWFRRIWVIQEVTNARQASVHIGRYVLNWNLFSNTIRFMLGYGLESTIHGRVVEVQNLNTMVWLRNAFSSNEKYASTLRLLEVLAETRSFKSTHAVDKIYGLLSMFPNNTGDVEVDYDRSAEEIFTRYAIGLLENGTDLYILNHCTPPTEAKVLNLPSWVPDWTQPTYTEPLYLRGLEGKATGNTERRLRIDSNVKTLFIYGKLIANITAVEKLRLIPSRDEYRIASRRFYGEFRTPEQMSKALAEVSAENDVAWNGAVVQMVTKNLSRPVPKDLWRVFMCNQTRENKLPNPLCETAFKVFMTAHFWRRGLNSALKENRVMGDVPDTEEMGKAVNELQGAFSKWCYNRRFFETECGAFGWAMDGVLEGDKVCVFYGGEFPFVIRPVENGGYRVVSDCYVQGFMDGEALGDRFEDQEFQIV